MVIRDVWHACLSVVRVSLLQWCTPCWQSFFRVIIIRDPNQRGTIQVRAKCCFTNNYNGHFYGAWSLARSRAQCAVQKAAEKYINTYNGQNKKVSGQPRKNLHTAIKVLERSKWYKRMGFEFIFWKLKRFCTGDGAMVTDAQVRHNDLCECIWVVCMIRSVNITIW